MEDKKIKILLLDVGGVLIKLNWKNFFKTLDIPEVINGIEVRNWFDKDSKHKLLEKGFIDFPEFFNDFNNQFSLHCNQENFEKAWNSIIECTHDGIESLLAEVKKEVPLKILSNTNKVHFDPFSKWSPFKHFDRFFLSFELGLRKPEKDIYRKVLQETNIGPENILFIDDMKENLKEARSLGFQTEFCLNSSLDLKNILIKYKIIK